MWWVGGVPHYRTHQGGGVSQANIKKLRLSFSFIHHSLHT